MRNPTRVSDALSRRKGVAIFYLVAVFTVMIGFCSLAVDLGRVQAAKTEIRRAADAAARAGAAYLAQSNSNVLNAAVTMAANNKVDISPLVLSKADVTIGVWHTDSKKFTASGSPDNVTTFSAVQVVAKRTAANGNPIPLLFGSILGAKTCDVSATSVAALIAIQSPKQVYISAHSNPWLAGEPAGTLGSVPDNGYGTSSRTANKTHPWKNDVANPAAVAAANAAAIANGAFTAPTDPTKVASTDYTNNEPYESPSQFVLDVQPGSVVQVSIPRDSNNVVNNQGFLNGGKASYYADGTDSGSLSYYSDDAANPSLPQGTQTTSGSEHGISNIITPINSVVGVFLDKNASTNGADSETAPSGVDFSVAKNRDYTTYEPKLNQSFYVGTGQNSSGVQQTIVVPNNTYALFLGTMDGHEWSNNLGGFQATITQFSIELVK